jgi:hypothetical protein
MKSRAFSIGTSVKLGPSNFTLRKSREPNVARAGDRYGSITSFRAGDVDFRFTLDTGRLSALQRTVEEGRFCCKSRFALVTENSAGRGRGFPVKM